MARKGALAFNGLEYGQIIDVSEGGISFQYISRPGHRSVLPIKRLKADTKSLDIVFSDYDFTLIDVPVNLIGDFQTPALPTIRPIDLNRKRSFSFAGLTPDQRDQLKRFLVINRYGTISDGRKNKSDTVHPTRDKTRILIAKDHDVLRKTLLDILADFEEFEIIGAAMDDQGTIQQHKNLTPDLVLLDLSLQNENSINVLKEIKKSRPQTSVLVMSVKRSSEQLRTSISAGADGYVLLDKGEQELLHAMRTVIDGKKYISG
jgi:CheY-like chemotaxis protein